MRRLRRTLRTPRRAPATLAAELFDRRGLSTHILPTSATMVGVCMTVLSIGRIGSGANWHMLIDKFLAIDALIFLTSALLSFGSMRTHRGSARYEQWAETVFVCGLGLLALVATVLAFTIR